MMDVAEWANERGLRLEILDGPTVQVEDGWEHNAYRVALLLPGARMVTPWKAGMGVRGIEPAGVLNSLVIDAQAGDEDFEDFCRDFGYDRDSRRAWKTWEACRQARVGLAEFVGGGEFERLVSGEIEGL